MAFPRFIRFSAILFGALAGLAAVPAAAQNPSVAEALAFKPIQAHVEYAIPSKEEIATCTIRAEKENNVTAWVVRNRQGEILRRFADTNGDNVVDQWCYYFNGLEVYRDVDSNFNKKADQYRWFNTGGMRWGIDKNEDGRVDSWRAISPHEVAEQVVLALKGRDAGRFELLLLTPEELRDSGFGKSRAEKLAEGLKTAPARFSRLAAEQKAVGAESRFIDFGSARPARIPTGTDGSTKDVIVLDNAAALVETGGKHEQVFLGAVVAVGETWKLLDVPTVGGQNQPAGDFLLGPLAQAPAAVPGAGAPNDEMQKLMAELDQLYREGERLPPEKQAANIDQRAEKLERLAQIAPEADREQWYRQLAGMISVGMQTGAYPKGGERLERLQKKLENDKASNEIVAAVAYQRLWADHVVAQQQPNGNAAQILEKWLEDLEKFVKDYPKSGDAAEALLNLGMYQEFAGKNEEATKWYRQLIQDFPKAEQAPKANGALRRLNSIGKPVALRGTDLRGETVDLQAPPYRGRAVVIHYWATWCVPCKTDMTVLKDVLSKRGGSGELQIIGVCLDADAAEARRYVTDNRIPWRHIHEPGGLDGRLANEMGVMTLPLTVLVDPKGNVVHHNIHVGPDLETELAKLIRPTTGTANTRRDNTPRR